MFARCSVTAGCGGSASGNTPSTLTFVFFLTWFPTYLATERHMDWIRVGIFTALPYIAGFFSNTQRARRCSDTYSTRFLAGCFS